MKKIITLAALLLSFASLTWALNYDFSDTATSGQTLYYNINSGTNTVTVTYPGSDYYHPYDGYTYPTGALTIPSTVTYNSQNYSVTSIGEYAFYGCYSLTSFTIPNSVTSIGDYAFAWCSGLTSVTIPNSVTAIGIGAFSGCTSLTSVTIPNSVTAIGIGAFSYCSGLTSFTIPNSVTEIESFIFEGCSGLASVTIPNSVTSIGNGAFHYCSGLTSVTIPNSVTEILSSAFGECSGLTSVTIGSSVTTFGNWVFSGCTNLTSVAFNAINCTYMGDCCFSGSSSLTYLTIGDSVQNIPAKVFENCSSLTYVTIGNSVTSIGQSAFSGCSSLTSVTIPNSVTSIGDGAFDGCTSLTSVTVGNSVTSIGKNAFSYCPSLTSVTIPNSVDTIGSEAFTGCTSLASVAIGNSVATIGNGVFAGCSSLTSVTIPNSVAAIGNYAFTGCTSLTSVTIGNSVTEISSWAFGGCSGLTEITSHASTAPQLGSNAFNGMSSTIPVYIPCGSRASYDSTWSCFSNFIEESEFSYLAYSTDAGRGFVQVVSRPTCTNPEVVLDAVPAQGYHFGHWSDGNTDNPRSLVLTGDTTVLAIFFSDQDFTITVVSADSTMGSVTGSGSFADGSTTTITATANDGYHFVRWSDGNTERIRTITVTADAVYTAYFEPGQGIGNAAHGAMAIHASGGRIMVEGVGNATVRLYDCMGRCLQTLNATETCTLQVPSSGVYLVQVGNSPAQRVVVAR